MRYLAANSCFINKKRIRHPLFADVWIWPQAFRNFADFSIGVIATIFPNETALFHGRD